MSSAKTDSSGIFDSVALQLGTKKATIYDNSFQLSPNGVTFKTDTSLPAWTEVDMELRLPVDKSASKRTTGRHKTSAAQKIGCRGVVVQSEKEKKSGPRAALAASVPSMFDSLEVKVLFTS